MCQEYYSHEEDDDDQSWEMCTSEEKQEANVNNWDKVETSGIDKLINKNNDQVIKNIDNELAIGDNLAPTLTKPISCNGSNNNNNWNDSSAWSDKWLPDKKDADFCSSDSSDCNGGRQPIQNLLQVPRQQTR